MKERVHEEESIKFGPERRDADRNGPEFRHGGYGVPVVEYCHGGTDGRRENRGSG